MRDLSLVQEARRMTVAAIEVLAHPAWAKTGAWHPSESMAGIARIMHLHKDQPELVNQFIRRDSSDKTSKSVHRL